MLTISPAVKALAHLVETRDVHVDQQRRHHRPHHRQEKAPPGENACVVVVVPTTKHKVRGIRTRTAQERVAWVLGNMAHTRGRATTGGAKASWRKPRVPPKAERERGRLAQVRTISSRHTFHNRFHRRHRFTHVPPRSRTVLSC